MTPSPTVDEIGAAIARSSPRRVPLAPRMTQAAVAAIVRDAPAGADLLFILRAERDGDPWSGHVAFPGGRVEASDADAHAAAVRETFEEIGLDLRQRARPLGELGDVIANAHGTPLPMVIRPFAFALTGNVPPGLTMNHEVRDVVWLPLSFLLDPAKRGTLSRRIAGVPIDMPCYRFDGGVLWGLTLCMVDDLGDLLIAK